MVSLTAPQAVRKADDQRVRDAFTLIYRQHLNAVYRYVRVRVDSDEEAQDVTAQTFESALGSFRTFRGEADVIAWLFGIARHKVADHIHKHYRRQVLPLDEKSDLIDPLPLLEEQVGIQVQLERVGAALDGLATERAEALRLHLFGGLSFEETAAVMGKRETAVKMLISRGLADLRLRLKQEEKEA